MADEIKNISEFDKQLQDLKNGNLPDSHVFNLGKPSEILQNCGFPPNDRIELAASRLRLKAGQGNHLFDIMDITGLDKALQNPVAVFEYGDRAKSQNIIANIKKYDKNFLVGVFFNQHRDGFEVTSIRGLFNRDNIDWLRWIQQGKMIYGNKDEIQVLAAQQRTNLADVNSKEARTSSDSYYLDSVDNILHKFGDVKDIYTKDFPEYAKQKERFAIFKQFRTAYQENDSINVYDAVREADEFYDALKANNKSILEKYTDGIEKPELSNAATDILNKANLEKSSQVQEVDLSYYYDRFKKETANRNEEIRLQKAIELALEKETVQLQEVKLNRENWNKLFPTGTVETPIGTVKLGENQFEKLQKNDRNNLLAAMYETLSNPAIILEKETLDEKTGEFRPVNVYGKSFVREDSDHKKAIESVVIFKDGENISIGTHNKELGRFTRQIKTADQIIFADSEISRVTSLILQNGGSQVQLKGINTQALNTRYDKNNLLSIKDLQFSNADVKKDTDKSKTFDSNSSIIFGKTILPSFAVIADKTLHSVENAVVKAYDKEKKSYLVDNGIEKLELPKATFDTLFNDKLDKDRTEAKIAEGRTIVFRNKEMGIQGTVIPEFAMYTQKGLETFKDCVPVQYNKSENTYTISNEKTSITISAEQFREVTSPERFENKFDENTPAWKKLCEQQYKDFFEQRDNTAYNFRHNLSVYCRKEAGSPCDALHLAKEIISRMSAEEQKQTKKLLKSMAHEGESTNELIARVYHEAIKGQPLNEDYIKKYEPNSFIKRPFYDTVSENGQKIEDDPTLIRGETDRNLKIGMSIKNINIKTDKVFGRGKEALHFDSLKVVSASKETNTITLMDSNKSYFKLPRDTVLAHYKEQQIKEMKIEQRHNRSNSMNISYS